MIALTNVRVIPMDGDVLEGATVVIDEGEINSVAVDVPTPKGSKVIDCSGKTVIPGLIDAHVHMCLPGDLSFATAVSTSPQVLALRAGQSMLRTLLSGTTMVRDVGGIHGIEAILKGAVIQRQIPGPRMQTSAQIVAITGGHGYFLAREADGPDEVRKATREQLRAGADWVKLMASAGFALDGEEADSPQLDLDELTVAVREAAKAGKRAAGHAHPPEAIKDLIRAGAASVEHCSFVDDEGVAALLEHDVAMVPTFTVYWEMIHNGSATVPAGVRRAVETAWDRKQDAFRRAVDAGVRVVAGTDSGPPSAPHGNLAKELELLVEGGMTPHGALAAATINAADLLGVSEQLGTVTAGKLADLVVLDGDPLADISAVRRVTHVFANGVIYEPNDLRVGLGV